MSTHLTHLQNQVQQVSDSANINLGGIGDGSYATSLKALAASDVFISGGISSNCEFEFDVYRQHPTIKMFLVDKSVSKFKLIAKGFARVILGKKEAYKYLYNAFIYLWLVQKGTFIPRFIDQEFTIKHILQLSDTKDKRLFLKFDIEGAEYLLFEEIIQLKSSITQLSIEIHDFAKRSADVISFFESLSSDLSIIDLRINNSGGHENGVPNCIELTLVNKQYL